MQFSDQSIRQQSGIQFNGNDVGGLQSSAESVVYVLPTDNTSDDSEHNDGADGLDEDDGADGVDDYEANGGFDGSGASERNATACFISSAWQ